MTPLDLNMEKPLKNPQINGGFDRWEHHLFLCAMASMAMLVITRGYIR